MVCDVAPSYVDLLYKPRSVAKFKTDLDAFLTHYKPISLADIIAINKGEKELTEPSFHLTFDDGLSNFKDIVAPILLEKRIPATVFLNTDFVDNKALFYRYKANLIYRFYNDNYETDLKKIFDLKIHQLNNIIAKKQGEETSRFSNASELSVLDFLFQMEYENSAYLDDLAQEVNFSFEDFLEKETPYLSLIDIKALEKQGITFGGHSANHPNYKDLSLIDQLQQTRSSLNWIKKNLNQKDLVFSFPFSDIGISKSFFNEMTYGMAISFGTSGFKTDEIVSNLQRLDMEKYKRSATSVLTTEYLKLGVKKVLGKDKIWRKE